MGIKFFFKWLKKTYGSHIKTVTHQTGLEKPIDHFLIDMNGVIHYCCQKLFKYGAFAEEKKSTGDEKNDNGDERDSKRMKIPEPTVNQIADEMMRYIDRIVRLVKPQKTLFLAIDGVAPLSKQFQQRSRRYRSSTGSAFDSNSITPGTEFLHALCGNIHRWITRRIQKEWSNLQVLFSSETVPGEGEHKLVKWVREFGNPRESFMMHGMDADLVMLALATHFPHFHILRENSFRPEQEFFHISIESIRQTLINSIVQDLSEFTDTNHINDFIVMIFFTGNDFLPTIPTIELHEGGADYMFACYRQMLAQAGPLTNEAGFLRADALSAFFATLSSNEVNFFEQKRKQAGRFPDRLLNAHTQMEMVDAMKAEVDETQNTWRLDFEKYREAYYREKLNVSVADESQVRTVCEAYLEGMQWVLDYYLRGVPHWKWAYPYLYAPFVSDLAKYASFLDRPSYVKMRENTPFSPILQLLCVLPKKSSNLLPPVMIEIMEQIGTRGYPDEFEVDVDGKFHDWEGIVKLPVLPWKEIEQVYRKMHRHLNDDECLRNRFGRTFLYQKGVKPTPHPLMF